MNSYSWRDYCGIGYYLPGTAAAAEAEGINLAVAKFYLKSDQGQ
uniref:Auxin response factor n=1 Tax=Rhizophora mucronata TaxID=61149 RepID=A0A2P2Q935_RHIMU